MTHQEDILKEICCKAHGAVGCEVSLGSAARLIQLGLVCLAPTREGIEYLTGQNVLSPADIERWIHGIRIRKGKSVRIIPQSLLRREPRPRSEPKMTKKLQELEENIAKAEEADRIWWEEQKAARDAKFGIETAEEPAGAPAEVKNNP